MKNEHLVITVLALPEVVLLNQREQVKFCNDPVMYLTENYKITP